MGSSARTDIPAFKEVAASRHLSTTRGFGRGPVAASLAASMIDEPLGPLGSKIARTSVFRLPAETRFGAMFHSDRTSEGLTVWADAAFDRTGVGEGLLGPPGLSAVSGEWGPTAIAVSSDLAGTISR